MISLVGSSKQVVRTSRMLDSLFPEVLSKLTYSSRAERGGGTKGFLDGSGKVLVTLICWGRGREGELCEGEEVWQFQMLYPVFLHLKHHPSFIHLAHSTWVSLDRVTVSTSMALGSWCGRDGECIWGAIHP